LTRAQTLLWNQAVELDSNGETQKALLRIQLLRSAAPELVSVLLAEARLYRDMGKYEEAYLVYELNAFEPNVLEAKGETLLEQGRFGEAAKLFGVLQRLGWKSAWVLGAWALAPEDPMTAAELIVEGVTELDGTLDYEKWVSCTLWVGKHLIDSARPEDALNLYEQVIQSPIGPSRVLLDAQDEARVEVQAALLWGSPEQRLTGLQRERLAQIRLRLAAGQEADARVQVELMMEEEPFQAEVILLAAEISAVLEEYQVADQRLRIAEKLLPLDADISMRIGDLLMSHFGVRFREEALDAYARSVSKDPTRRSVWARKAELELMLGRVAEARISVGRMGDYGSASTQQASLALRLENEFRERLALPEIPHGQGCGGVVDVESCRQFYRAMARFYRGRSQIEESGLPSDWELALEKLDSHGPQLRNYAPSFNLRGTIHLTQGLETGNSEELNAAEVAFRESLELNGNQPEVLTLVGILAQKKGDLENARAMWIEAAGLTAPGSAAAHYHLALDAADRWRWWTARRHLQFYFQGPNTSHNYEQAVMLQQRISRPIRWVYGGVLGSGTIGLLIVLIALWRRFSGATITELLSERPEAYPDVARVCAAIRHEVIKHNTPLLELCGANVDSDPAWIQEKLFGKRGAIARFFEYVGELESVGRGAGIRLNLHRRDPVFSELIRSMSRLKAQGAGALARQEKGALIQELSEEINEKGFTDLGILLDGMCTFLLTPDFVRSNWRRVLQEPALVNKGEQLALQVLFHCESPRVRVAQTHLEDIFCNLMRNGAVASLAEGVSQLAVIVALEEDPVTAESLVRIEFADQVTQVISTEMIRSQYVERGLGLACRLIGEVGGAISVASSQDFAKAIVVRLQMRSM
jgi:tetratricopeptide (TPR) repeat protein